MTVSGNDSDARTGEVCGAAGKRSNFHARVLVLAENYFEGKGGGDLVIRRLVDWLSNEKIDFTIVAKRPRSEVDLNDGKYVLYDLPGGPQQRLLTSIFEPILSYLRTRHALSRLHCWGDAQIVWTLMERGACIARRLSPRATIVFSPGEVYPSFRSFLSTEGIGTGRLAVVRRFVAWWWLSRMQHCAVDAADGVIAISSHVKEQLRRRYKKLGQVLVSYNPAPEIPRLSDADRERIRSGVRDSLGIPRSAYTFVSAGRLTLRKGFDLLLDAFAALSRTDAHLVICGEGELLDELREKSAGLGVERRVHFAGYVSPIWRHFVAADCFVSTAVFEPFGNVFVEAMACGLPVIGLAGPDDGVETATAEIIQGDAYGSIVRGKDLEALIQRMREMSEQSGEKRARVANAATAAIRSRFSSDVVLSDQFRFAVGLRSRPAASRVMANPPVDITDE